MKDSSSKENAVVTDMPHVVLIRPEAATAHSHSRTAKQQRRSRQPERRAHRPKVWRQSRSVHTLLHQLYMLPYVHENVSTHNSVVIDTTKKAFALFSHPWLKTVAYLWAHFLFYNSSAERFCFQVSAHAFESHPPNFADLSAAE